MKTESSTGTTGCVDGLITVPTADGPEQVACTGPCCRARRAVQARYVRPGFTAALLDAVPDDQEW